MTRLDGQELGTHTAGQRSFASVGFEMANGGELHPIMDVFEKTHKRKNGKFVNKVSEKLYNKVTEKILDCETQLSLNGNPVQSGGLNVSQKDDIFREVAPKKKNRIFGIGSIQDVLAASSNCPWNSSEDPVQLRTQLETANIEIAELQKNYEGLDQLWKFSQMKAQLLQRLYELDVLRNRQTRLPS